MDKEEKSQEVSESDFTEETESNETEEKKADESKSAEELEKEKKKNAYFAEQRRKQEAKIKQETELKVKLDLMKTNEFTEEPIEDEEDLRIYEIQREIKKQGGDPIKDLGKELAKRNREERKKQQQEEDFKKKTADDIADFKAKFPKVDTAELSRDPLFKEVANDKIGKWTTEEIYTYLYLPKKDQRDAEEQAKKMSKVPNPNNSSSEVAHKKLSEMNVDEYNAYMKAKYGRS